jgi:hypothetical protein
MTRLVVCCDGTWNTPDQEKNDVPTPTNVVRIYNALLEDAEQKRYYHPGVGTDGSRLDRLRGGGMGTGLARNIKSAYAWLARQYRPGDSIHLFGFSRGAYTVRSLAGMLRACGLLELTAPPAKADWAEIDRLYDECYRPDGDAGHRPDYTAVEVEFLGVWDTVGALGVPDQFGVLNLFDVHERHRFADTRLGPHIRHARHALALDEARGPFTPTLWANADEVDGTDGRTVKQMWFAGDHCGVGGGYVERGLSDLALGWMIDEARACGLTFHEGIAAQVLTDGHADVLHDSCTGFYDLIGPVPRAVPLLDSTNPSPHVHPSVLARQACPPITAAPYRPNHVVGVGESVTRPVYAGTRPACGWRRGSTSSPPPGSGSTARCRSGPTGPTTASSSAGRSCTSSAPRWPGCRERSAT